MLNKIKDNFANMYEGEILKFTGDEFRTLSFLRIKAGENGVLWYSKDSLRESLQLGRDKINKILNNLEDAGAIIVFNAKDNKTKKNASNVYYLPEYNSIDRNYMTANTLEEIKIYALGIREQKELEYSVKNNLKPRQFILEERLPKETRKIKFYIQKPPTENQYMAPPTENQYMAPPTENQYMEPCTENQYIINNKKTLNNKKEVNNNNIIKKRPKTVVVNNEYIPLVKNYMDSNIATVSLKEAEILVNDLITSEQLFNFDIFKERTLAIKNYSGNIKNVVGMLRKAIREKWNNKSLNHVKVDPFNNYEQRQYDFNDLERKLLGWDKE